MAPLDPIPIQRAAGSALRSLRIKGAPPHRLTAAARNEPLKPSLAIGALLAAMRARFDLAESAANELLRPAIADWRDAVGCADPPLLPANALGSAGEKHLIPIPIPSWCASLVDAGVLRLDGPPTLDGPRVVQHAWLAVWREAAVTWAMPRGLEALAPAWPSGWPRWAVLRVREGREPQALWELPALWRACIGPAPEAEVASSVSPSPGTLRLAVDVGSTSTVV